jgi:hypothetical protein
MWRLTLELIAFGTLTQSSVASHLAVRCGDRDKGFGSVDERLALIGNAGL